jgi:hypothetical protein
VSFASTWRRPSAASRPRNASILKGGWLSGRRQQRSTSIVSFVLKKRRVAGLPQIYFH